MAAATIFFAGRVTVWNLRESQWNPFCGSSRALQ